MIVELSNYPEVKAIYSLLSKILKNVHTNNFKASIYSF